MGLAFVSAFLSAVAHITAKVVLIRLRGILTMERLSLKQRKTNFVTSKKSPHKGPHPSWWRTNGTAKPN